MKQKTNLLVFVLLLGFSIVKINAQSDVVHLYDSVPYFNIGKSLHLLEEKNKRYTFEEIRKAESEFIKSESTAPNYGTTGAVVWFYTDINLHSRNVWFIELDAPWIDSFIVYYPVNGTYRTKFLGRRFPPKNQELSVADLVYKISSKDFPLDTVLRFYFRTNGKVVVLPTFIGLAEEVVKEEHTKELFYAAYCGIVLVLALMYLAIYITSRKKENLYYVLWIISSTAYFAITKGFLKLVLPDSLQFLVYHSVEPVSIAGLMLLLFNRSSLNIRKNLPSWNKWFTLFNWSMIGILGMCFLGYNQLALQLFEPLMLLMMTFSLIAGFKVYRAGQRYAGYYILAYAQTLINVGIYILVFMKALPFTTYTSNSSLIGTLIETILLSLGLGAKIREVEQEKEKARRLVVDTLRENEKIIKQQNEILETKVLERTRLLAKEKSKSDDLLRNILPAETVHELKLKGYSEPKKYDSVTVMFTDFKDFTLISQKVSPEELVAEIGTCFRAFDKIMGKYGLEKIKTIGDSYMCAGGLPTRTHDHAIKTIEAAHEIMDFMKKRKQQNIAEGEIRFEIRIGINSGSVVAGVVGAKKFAYDIWGDAVNTASRMEQYGEGGKINISGSTYDLVKDNFSCTYRGKIETKSKGMIDMYFVS